MGGCSLYGSATSASGLVSCFVRLQYTLDGALTAALRQPLATELPPVPPTAHKNPTDAIGAWACPPHAAFPFTLQVLKLVGVGSAVHR